MATIQSPMQRCNAVLRAFGSKCRLREHRRSPWITVYQLGAGGKTREHPLLARVLFGRRGVSEGPGGEHEPGGSVQRAGLLLPASGGAPGHAAADGHAPPLAGSG